MWILKKKAFKKKDLGNCIFPKIVSGERKRHLDFEDSQDFFVLTLLSLCTTPLQKGKGFIFSLQRKEIGSI